MAINMTLEQVEMLVKKSRPVYHRQKPKWK